MIEKRLLKKINFIEIYQVIGGVIGLLFISYLMFTTDLSAFQNFMGYVTMVTPFLFFGLCIYSGILLNKKKYRQGFNLVYITLLLQLASFEISDLFYSAINGIGIRFTLDLTKNSIIGFDFHLSQFVFGLHSDVDNFILKFNLIAVAMLFYTAKVFREIKY